MTALARTPRLPAGDPPGGPGADRAVGDPARVALLPAGDPPGGTDADRGVSCDGGERGERPGSVLVPLYVHPLVDPAAWRVLEGAGTPLYGVVVNVADGPGVRSDPVFAAATGRLRGAGVRLLGYVDTRYGERPRGAVLRDLHRHRAWYGTDGVFFDRVASDGGRLPHYRWLARAARMRGSRTVVLNPGVHPDPGYAGVADLLVTFEGSWADYRAAEVPAWTSGHPAERFCHLVYDVPGDVGERAVARTAATRGAAVHCAVPGGPPNPWQSAPGLVRSPA